ncbi:hypothetical protein PoB_000047100 [Plakobranchus ocellatus]|uniref:Reverse transcriptase domain-containing protein n=1 Tax=Plakobranchus ocellatus TaxID=259542 RepID=A0AAV3XSL5_9GAST|nr:hypothetical protein PoB_000047100 [Plakobranchus ocellatus]
MLGFGTGSTIQFWRKNMLQKPQQKKEKVYHHHAAKYEDVICQSDHEGKLAKPFSIQTVVRESCFLSPTISLKAVDWIMRLATTSQTRGIQWLFIQKLEDFDFADDISLLLHRHQDAQEKLCRVLEEAASNGLQMNMRRQGSLGLTRNNKTVCN